jgi:hypothetical protein
MIAVPTATPTVASNSRMRRNDVAFLPQLDGAVSPRHQFCVTDWWWRRECVAVTSVKRCVPVAMSVGSLMRLGAD